MVKLNALSFFICKKKAGDTPLITILIGILLALLVGGLLFYFIWRLGNVSLPKK